MDIYKPVKNWYIIDGDNHIVDSFYRKYTAFIWLPHYKKLFGYDCKVIRKSEYSDDKKGMSLKKDKTD